MFMQRQSISYSIAYNLYDVDWRGRLLETRFTSLVCEHNFLGLGTG